MFGLGMVNGWVETNQTKPDLIPYLKKLLLKLYSDQGSSNHELLQDSLYVGDDPPCGLCSWV